MALRLPEPMLTRTGVIPTTSGWLFEPKLDGFRCMVCTHDGQRGRERCEVDVVRIHPTLEILNSEATEHAPSSMMLVGRTAARR